MVRKLSRKDHDFKEGDTVFESLYGKLNLF